MSAKKFEVFETNHEYWKKHVEDLDAKVQVALYAAMGETAEVEKYLKKGYQPGFYELTTAYELIDLELGALFVKYGAEPSLRDIQELIKNQEVGFIYFMIKVGVPAEIFLAKDVKTRAGETVMGLAQELGDQKTIRLLSELSSRQSLSRH